MGEKERIQGAGVYSYVAEKGDEVKIDDAPKPSVRPPGLTPSGRTPVRGTRLGKVSSTTFKAVAAALERGTDPSGTPLDHETKRHNFWKNLHAKAVTEDQFKAAWTALDINDRYDALGFLPIGGNFFYKNRLCTLKGGHEKSFQLTSIPMVLIEYSGESGDISAKLFDLLHGNSLENFLDFTPITKRSPTPPKP